jgi:hypothetical protein
MSLFNLTHICKAGSSYRAQCLEGRDKVVSLGTVGRVLVQLVYFNTWKGISTYLPINIHTVKAKVLH